VTFLLAFVSGALGAAGLAMLAGLPRRGSGVDALVRRLAVVGARVRPVPAPRELEALLDAAGRPGTLSARELMAAKAACAVGGGLAGALALAAPGRLGPLLAVASPAVGFLAPDVWLSRLARRRAAQARSELPAALALLRVVVASGSSLGPALGSVGQRGEGPLALEWRGVSGRVALGVPLPAALERMSARLPLPELRALAAALERSARHGTPLAETLGAQARDASAARARRARERAARAAPKIQLVVALLLVPSVLLLVAAALLASLAGSGDRLLPV